MAPMEKWSKEFMNCLKNAETEIVNLTGVECLDEDGKVGFIERPVSVHYCNGGDIAQNLDLVCQYWIGSSGLFMPSCSLMSKHSCRSKRSSRLRNNKWNTSS